jgi:hypothetical protein
MHPPTSDDEVRSWLVLFRQHKRQRLDVEFCTGIHQEKEVAAGFLDSVPVREADAGTPALNGNMGVAKKAPSLFTGRERFGGRLRRHDDLDLEEIGAQKLPKSRDELHEPARLGEHGEDDGNPCGLLHAVFFHRLASALLLVGL